MADYAISNVARRVVYTNTGVGPYSFTFEILANTDIAVYRGSTLLTLTTDYSVTINANGTGSITLVTAGTGNITIVGARAIQRTSDYTTGGDLFASTLNTDLDSQTIYAQQVAETAERGLKAPVVDPTDINMTLPAKATRAGTVLAFNTTTGNPEAGPSIGSVTTVAAQSANINTVATNIASVNTVAGNNTNINTVAGISSNVTTVATNIANVNAVGSDLLEAVSEINTVATDITNVNNVGNNISNVNTVAGISANVTSVAGNSSNINTVAGNNANVTTVAGISGNVTTVAGISANVTTVAGINAAVSTVATNNANVSTVATNIAAVNTNATNIVAIQNASTNATNAATSATAAQTAQSAAESARDATLAAYDNFDDRYLGSKTSNPSLDNDGNALVAGALYFNSVSGAMQVYTGSAWVAAYVSGTGFLASANNLSDVASTSSARTNLGLGTGNSPTFTGLTVGAGTVSAPAITTSGDTNTGIYFPAADTIAFTEGGVESMRIDSSGNVGIGTSSPVEKLTVSGAISLNTDLVLKEGTTARGYLFGTSAGLHYRATSGLPHIFQNVGTELMRIDSSGNVGIGTSSPNDRLDIVGGNVRIASGNVIRFVDSGNVRVSIQGDTSSNAIFSTAGSERMRITSTGLVGIGLTNPSAPLNPAASNQTDNTKAALFVSDGTTTTKGVAVGYNSTPNYGFIQSVNKGVAYTFLSLQPEGANVLVGTTTNNGSGGTLQVSNGITFPATQSAVADANTLDDYEEGTWTPSVGGTATYSSQNYGRYTKIGNVVTVQFRISLLLIGTGSLGQIQGLPFASANISNVQTGSVSYYDNIAINTIFVAFYIENSATTLQFVTKATAGTIVDNGPAIMGNNTNILGTATYRVA